MCLSSTVFELFSLILGFTSFRRWLISTLLTRTTSQVLSWWFSPPIAILTYASSWAWWPFSCFWSRILLASFVTSFSFEFSAANCFITFTFRLTLRFTWSQVFHQYLCCWFVLFLVDDACFVAFDCFNTFLRSERGNNKRIWTWTIVYKLRIVHVWFYCSNVNSRVTDSDIQSILVFNGQDTNWQDALFYQVLKRWFQWNYRTNTTIQSLGLLIELILILFDLI